MKKIIPAFLAIVVVIAVSCNNNASSSNAPTKQEQPAASASTADTEPVKVVKASFTNVDAGVKAYIKKLTDNYLALKNALAADKGNDAAAAAKNMTETLKSFDKSLLTTEQKKVYDANEADLAEHAEHIAAKAGDIEHQRDHFSMMSEDLYSLVKAFGPGTTLYHDHCPMAKQNKGAMWLSETKDIKNPYLGSKMPDCGDVEEEIQ